MHLHEKSASRRPRSSPLRAHRLDARQYRHRLFGAGAGGHVERIVDRARCHDPRRRPADHLRRDHAVHRLAADGVADQPDRAPHAAHRDARGARAHQRGLGVCARLCQPAGHPPGHAGGRRALYAAGGRHRGADRARGKTRQHHRLYLSRLVAGGRGRPAADHLHRQPLRLARGLWQHRRDRLLSVSCCWRGGCRADWSARRSISRPGPMSGATG